MPDLREVLNHAQQSGAAVGHFNAGNFDILKAVFTSARDLKVPVIIGVSESEREYFGLRQISVLVRSLREESEFPIFLNADHTHSLAGAIEAAKAGFDAVVFDLSALPLEENIRQTKVAVEKLRSIHPAILIEGEIGDIGTGSQIHEAGPDQSKGLTSPEEAKRYVEETGVDILAPAVGNMHGMLHSMVEGRTRKRLDLKRIAEIKNATRFLMTLHGGSGTDDEDLRRAIAAGINIVHVNTELRVAWRHALQQSLAKDPQEVVPYRLVSAAVQAVQQVATARLQLFKFG